MPDILALKGGCWTCKTRKVACDRTTPACKVCSKSKRVCKGYGIRLSWPRPGDEKRTWLYNSRVAHGNVATHSWINASCRDIDLHSITSSCGRVEQREQIRLQLSLPWPVRDEVKPWPIDTTSSHDEELLRFFTVSVVPILPLFDTERNELSRVLIRLATDSDTLASKAVYYSILGLSSFIRDGEQVRTAHYKFLALEVLMLGTNTKTQLSPACAIKHVAASILLCIFEMHQRTLESSSWVGHVCCTQGVIRTLSSHSFAPGSDASLILSWSLYFDVLSRFSLRHWRVPLVKELAASLGFNPQGRQDCAVQYLLAQQSFGARLPAYHLGNAHPLLTLLSEISLTLSASDEGFHTQSYQSHLAELKTRLLSLDPETQAPHLSLFRLAALIYLTRTVLCFSGQSSELDAWIDEGFKVLRRPHVQRWPFVLFIFAVEARTDERRLLILQRLDQAGRELLHMHVQLIKAIIQKAWVQDDLAPGEELEYVRKMNLCISTSKAIPIFV